jgi:lycopene beta-cyclase
MTDMRMVNDEFCFTYVLPFAPNHLLAEVTFFARQPPSRAELQTQLTQLLTKRGWTEAQILRTEYGELPMGLPATSKYSPNQPLLAGMRGGALRPSSGYGFLRIQRWAEQCAQRYCEQARLVPQTTSGFWLQKMDLLFLAVLRKDPALAPELFDRLFGNTETERFIRFMDDRASLSDCLHIVACLPKTPFLKALFSSFPLLFRRQA